MGTPPGSHQKSLNELARRRLPSSSLSDQRRRPWISPTRSGGSSSACSRSTTRLPTTRLRRERARARARASTDSASARARVRDQAAAGRARAAARARTRRLLDRLDDDRPRGAGERHWGFAPRFSGDEHRRPPRGPGRPAAGAVPSTARAPPSPAAAPRRRRRAAARRWPRPRREALPALDLQAHTIRVAPRSTRPDAPMSDFRPLSENELSALSTEELIAYHHEARRLGRHAEARTALGVLVWSFEDRVRYWVSRTVPARDVARRRRHGLRERPQVLLRGHAARPVRRLAPGDRPSARDRLPPPRRAASRRGAPARGARARGGDLGHRRRGPRPDRGNRSSEASPTRRSRELGEVHRRVVELAGPTSTWDSTAARRRRQRR